MNIRHNVNIGNFSQLVSFLKRKNNGYKAKKSRVFSKEEFYKFLQEAEDSKYLMMKVALIFGIAGALRKHDLLQIEISDAEKDWTYVRDTTWPNLRKRALEKKDKIKKTGTGGGKESRLTEVDNKVLDILGKDSASVCGIGINDPIENEEEETNENLETENAIPSCSKHNAENCAEIETTQNIAALHKKVS
ncbi:hypothetical protein Zmor_006636 [Zophobas morio]|uniref:Uncharacterized protein n=1 Tax=Zophobas morio TaxID=2755281 RepID=A0AA38IV54_9CUCU|nr:hypothetical protein Zmor_006636 [Zophobas morio]